jgi:hypothetical protein
MLLQIRRPRIFIAMRTSNLMLCGGSAAFKIILWLSGFIHCLMACQSCRHCVYEGIPLTGAGTIDKLSCNLQTNN